MYFNRLTHQLLRDCHSTFKQKWRSLVMQIFGHEAYVNATNMATTSHCPVLDTDIYRLSSLDRSQLANRKLWNPFKWIEFLLVGPCEIVLWWFHRTPAITNDWADSVLRWAEEISDAERQKYTKLTFKAYAAKALAYMFNKLDDLYFLLSGIIIAPILHPIVNIATGLVRRPLAPVRYIIRPSIELMQDHPRVFLAMIAATLAIVACFPIFASSFLINHLPSIASNFLLAGTISSHIAVTAVVWSSLLKIPSLVHEIGEAWTKRKSAKKCCHQQVIQFKEGSTDVITALLHAINPKKTQVKKIAEQDYNYSLALFTGTESIFFPKNRQAIGEQKEEEEIVLKIKYKNLGQYASDQAELRKHRR